MSTKRLFWPDWRTVSDSFLSGHCAPGVTSTTSLLIDAPARSGARPTGSPDQQLLPGTSPSTTLNCPQKRPTSFALSDPSATCAPPTTLLPRSAVVTPPLAIAA